MRMWMVPPEIMCRKHLLGEHVELHMLVGSILKGKNIYGFINNNLVFPEYILTRHNNIVLEMNYRGYQHKSLICPLIKKYYYQLNPFPYRNILKEIIENNIKELANRCHKCRERINKYRGV